MRKFNLFILISLFFAFCLPVYGEKAEEAEEAPSVTVLQAVVNDDISLLAELVKQFAQIDEQDDNGKTPLIYAARNGSLLMTDVLIRLGADPTIKDKEGFSAIDWAEIGEDTLDENDISHQKKRIMLKALKKPIEKKIFQRILFDIDSEDVTVLNCDDLIESRELIFCQNKVDDKSNWNIYTLSGENIGMAQSITPVSHKGKEYFILEKWGEYSIILPSGIALREHLKQVTHRIDKNDNLVFHVVGLNGKKGIFNPNANTRYAKK